MAPKLLFPYMAVSTLVHITYFLLGAVIHLTNTSKASTDTLFHKFQGQLKNVEMVIKYKQTLVIA